MNHSVLMPTPLSFNVAEYSIKEAGHNRPNALMINSIPISKAVWHCYSKINPMEIVDYRSPLLSIFFLPQPHHYFFHHNEDVQPVAGRII